MFQVSVSPKTVLRCAGPRLVPFFKAIALYFVLYPNDAPGSSAYCFFKCLPILCLLGFVLSYSPTASNREDESSTFPKPSTSSQNTILAVLPSSMSLTGSLKQAVADLLHPEEKYRRMVTCGLLCSLLGDILLVYKAQGFLMPGIALFGVAQCCYAFAFSLHQQPLHFGVGIACWTTGLLIIAYFIPYMPSIAIISASTCYMALIFTMYWRALIRGLVPLQKPSAWTSLSIVVGASCFVMSDILLCYDIFCVSLEHGNALIMGTYYAAQMAIAISVMHGGAGLTPDFSEVVKRD